MQMQWFNPSAGYMNQPTFYQPLLSQAWLEQMSMAAQLAESQRKANSTSSSSQVNKKKSFTIDSILAEDNRQTKEMRRVSSHPYFPAVQMSPLQTQQHETKGMQMSRNQRNKRVRTIFTPEQLEALEEEFAKQQYMVGTERYYLATKLQLSEAQVKVWFQNRRIKWRKQNHEGGKLSDLTEFYASGSGTDEEMSSEFSDCSDSASDAGSV